ncbi:hypothetical protein AGMMS49975_00380 [Clostridia bacterium]|nr:hypothetical protein AGMMS49975_00380 [Clostridia bacterium]
MNKEIGGYFGLESFGEKMPYQNALLLNSARNALRYILRAYGIHKLFVPYYTCPEVWESVYEEDCEISFYDIGKDFLPTEEFPSDAYVLCNNYFGVCDENINKLFGKYSNLIIDNAQSFYSTPFGLASFYSPRKFFGLPDGGLLFCEKRIDEQLELDISFGRTAHLLKRHDLGASDGYSDFRANEASLSQQPIRKMSRLTQAMMGNINYEKVRKRRNENFGFLRKTLDTINEIKFKENIGVPMVYPFLRTHASECLRGKLLKQKIYIPCYWGEIERTAPQNSQSVYLSNNLLPLPIDQRYTADDMRCLVRIIKGDIEGE